MSEEEFTYISVTGIKQVIFKSILLILIHTWDYQMLHNADISTRKQHIKEFRNLSTEKNPPTMQIEQAQKLRSDL